MNDDDDDDFDRYFGDAFNALDNYNKNREQVEQQEDPVGVRERREEEKEKEKEEEKSNYSKIHWKLGSKKRQDKPIYKNNTKMTPEKFDYIYNHAKDYILPLYTFFSLNATVPIDQDLNFIDPEDRIKTIKPFDFFQNRDNQYFNDINKSNFRHFDNSSDKPGDENWNTFSIKIFKDYISNRGNCKLFTEQNKFQEDVNGQYIYPDQILRFFRFKKEDNENRAQLARKQMLKLDETGARSKKKKKKYMENIKALIFDNGDDWEMKNWYIRRDREGEYNALKERWNNWKYNNFDQFNIHFKCLYYAPYDVYYLLLKKVGNSEGNVVTLEDQDYYFFLSLEDLLAVSNNTTYDRNDFINETLAELLSIYQLDLKSFMSDVTAGRRDTSAVDNVVIPPPVTGPFPSPTPSFDDLPSPSLSNNDFDFDDLFNDGATEKKTKKSPHKAKESPPKAKKSRPKAKKSPPKAKKSPHKAKKSRPKARKSPPKAKKSPPKARKKDGLGLDDDDEETYPSFVERNISTRYHLRNNVREKIIDIPKSDPLYTPQNPLVNKNINYLRQPEGRCKKSYKKGTTFCKNDNDDYTTEYGYRGECPYNSNEYSVECEREPSGHSYINKMELRYYSRPANWRQQKYIDGNSKKSPKAKKKY